ncbi:MAG: thioredoxin family protein [Bacteroidales bacterium]
MEEIHELETLEQRIRSETGLLVYFSADRCSVCKVLKPKVKEMLAEEFPRMGMVYVDVERSPELSGQHRVFSLPTLLVFFDGHEQIRLSRNVGLHQLEDLIRRPYGLLFDN